MRWPLRRQIMLPLVAVAATSLAAVGAINAQLAARQTRDRIERQLQGVTTVLASTNFPLTDSVLAQMEELAGAEFVVTDDGGKTLTSSFAKPPKVLSRHAPSHVEDSPIGRRIELAGEAFFHRATPLPSRGGDLDARWLHVLFPEAEYRAAWQAAFLPPMLIGTVTLAAAAAVATLIARRISQATAQLGVGMLRIADGDFRPIELPATDDEIRDLSLAVNRTAEMLSDYDSHVRRTEQMRTVALLGAGLAHEMRNAATGCRIALDLHAEDCNQDGESLSVARRQLQLMESQLQRFLRAGKSPSALDERELDLAALVSDLIPLVRPAAQHAGVELQWTPPEQHAPILADGEALGQAIVNLLLNAIEAVQQVERGERRVVGAELRYDRPGFAKLVISDNGPGPREAVADRLFTPFVTSKPEGIGLGLAVVKGVVEAHGGTVDWARARGVTSFRIEIPLAKKVANDV